MTRADSRRPAPAPDAHGRAVRIGLAAVGSIGLLILYHPMLLSGFSAMQGTEDSRLANYLLEHGYRWARRDPPHRRFWDTPMFHPARNTAGYSDAMLAIGPVYWAWRAAGFRPDTALQLWMLSASVLNYLAAYWLLRSGFRRGAAGSIAGAFLFAFSAPRANEIEHPQLTAQVFTIVAIMALIRIFRDRSGAGDGWRAFALWPAAGLAAVAQFYTSFYLGWFLVLSTAVAGTWGLILPRYRSRLVEVIREQWPAIGLGAVVAIAAIRPLMEHYLLAMTEVGPRDYWAAVAGSIPDWRALVYMGPWSWSWGWLPRLITFHRMGLEQAMRAGVGPLTTAACLVGLLAYRREPGVRLVALTMLGLWMAIARIDRPVVEGAAIGFWTACLLELHLDRGGSSPVSRWILGGIAALLALTIAPSAELAAIPIVLAGLLLVAPRMGTGRVAAGAGLLILVAAIGFPFLTTHANRPVALGAGTALAVVLWIAGRRPGPAGGTGPILIGGTIACAALWAFPSDVNLWPYVSRAIPGGQALRAVARGLVLGLVPASVGLAGLVDLAVGRRMPRGLLAALGLVVLLEQGVTIPGDRKEHRRADVAALARKIEPACRSFYYSPRGPESRIAHDHLDAMWAGIEAGVPTVNGYSGSAPPGWSPLERAILDRPEDRDRIRRALSEWAGHNGMAPDEICWIRGDDGPPRSGRGPDPH